MLTFRSPAKINLFLRVVSKRPDGYHELASLFQAISLFDHIHIGFADADEFTCSDPRLPTDASNLVLKAVALFRKKTGMQSPLKIHLEKHIPAEAGLGGGSSNAATTLWALNQLHGRPVAFEELKQWSAEIGSDITFFFSRGTAFCTGRGEIIQELPLLKAQPLHIVKPPYGLSTPSVYKALDLNTVSDEHPEALLQSFLSGAPRYVNDLETPAFALKPELALLKQKLQTAAPQVVMSGSGTSFCCFAAPAAPLSDEASFVAEASFASRPSASWY